LLPLTLTGEGIEGVRGRLPELPEAKAARFARQYGLGPQDVALLVEDQETAAWFEKAVGQDKGYAKPVANWMTGELFRRLKDDGGSINEIRFEPQALTELVTLVETDTVSLSAAKVVFSTLWEEGGSPGRIVEARGLGQISDEGALESLVAQVVAQNPEAVAKVRAGNEKPVQFLLGQVMKASRGKANPQTAAELLRRRLQAEE
ncbi:MAG: Asp-tRNA(Asn)/Glu-tRNA(Gln) amidotransferase GatCAB subunit B, partial [Candidatus Latescibacterota bacterium]